MALNMTKTMTTKTTAPAGGLLAWVAVITA